MIRDVILITCLVPSVLICGCLEQVSSQPAVEMNQNIEEHKTADTAMTVPSEKNNPTVIAYYFHRTIRCPECITIEANAARVIEKNFSRQIDDESLVWLPFNLDEPGGEDFTKEFDISISTLILAKIENGNHTEYKKLEDVWDLIDDPVKFDTYIQNEVRQFLNE